MIIRFTKYEFDSIEQNKFDYSFHDSLFKAIKDRGELGKYTLKKKENLVDSEAELSDFSNKKKVSKTKRTSLPEIRSININTAGVKDLNRLPGIGLKTASKIIEYRQNYGDFNSVDDLLEVKGIGKKKLEKIKSYIYIEK